MAEPWLKFYPSDWRADPALRICSLGARGLWMEMLCLMHEATPRGSLVVGGITVTDKYLAGLAGRQPKEVAGLVKELETAGVFSRDNDGTIYSRRMRRDIEKAARDKANGGKGGNPKLNRGVNPEVVGGDKAQKPEARSQKQASLLRDEPEPSAGSDPGPLSTLRQRVIRGIAEAAPTRVAPMPDTGQVEVWAAAGIHPDTIVAVIRDGAARKPEFNSLSYFDRRMREEHEKRPKPALAPAAPSADQERRAHLIRGRAHYEGGWHDNWEYPRPGEHGFPEDVAAELAAEFEQQRHPREHQPA